MSDQVKRYDAVNPDGTCAILYEDVDYGAYVRYEDYATLQAEFNSLWSTYIALVDKRSMDTDKARKVDGKPSDVFYVYALQAECDMLRAELASIKEKIVP